MVRMRGHRSVLPDFHRICSRLSMMAVVVVAQKAFGRVSVVGQNPPAVDVVVAVAVAAAHYLQTLPKRTTAGTSAVAAGFPSSIALPRKKTVRKK